MLLIYFRYPMLGTGRTIDYHRGGADRSLRLHGGVAVLDGAVHAQLPEGGAGRGARVGVLAVPAPRLTPAEAARRAAAAPGAFWLSAPAADESRIGRDLVGARPTATVRGTTPGDLARLEQAWAEARAAWGGDGEAPAGVPVAVGWLSYELGRRLVGLAPREVDHPLFEFHFNDAVWVRDETGAATIHARDSDAAGRLADLLSRPSPAQSPAEPSDGASGPGRARGRPPASDVPGRRRANPRLPAGGGCLSGEPVATAARHLHGGRSDVPCGGAACRRAGAARRVHRRRRRGRFGGGRRHHPRQLARAISLALDGRRGRDAPDQGDPPPRRRRGRRSRCGRPSSPPPPRTAPSTS